MKWVKIKDLPERKIILNDGFVYTYKVDKKQKHIARNTGKCIIVNLEFENLKEDYKKTIYYHEKGHFFWFNKLLSYISFISICLWIILILMLIFFITKKGYLSFFISLIMLISLVLNYVLSRYLIEIICDFNALKNMGIKNFNEAIINYYKKHNNLDFIEHPYWKWRKRIMEELD